LLKNIFSSSPTLEQNKLECYFHASQIFVVKKKGALYAVLHSSHRYRKSLNRLLMVCYVPATSAILIAFFSCFFAEAINSTNEANKAAGTAPLSSLFT
jgi:hypothetical protein